MMSTTDPKTLLQYLDVLLKFGNFTKAAKNLYISQPYLSQVIFKTEEELGTKIINRKSPRLQLTEAGKLFYQHLESLEHEINKFHEQLSHYTAHEKNYIKAGILPSLGTYLLPLFVPTFYREFPNSQLLIDEDLPRINEEHVLAQQNDFYIGQNPETVSPNLIYYETQPYSYYAIIPPMSPLYKAGILYRPYEEFSIKDLLSNPLVLTSAGSAIRRQIDHILQHYHIQPTILMESSNIYTVAELAKQNLGVTFVPQHVLSVQPEAQYNLVELPQKLISLKYFIAHSANKTLTASEKGLIDSFMALTNVPKKA